ncbi:hypothetical protein F4561_006480 [Lipingzhangella halophila]|uniref:Uncharacterized protein n=1 Tax=Lipingzhangella halophila TaxID=1783352 RepID=A0A7W7RP76_9ACTN|nr:hypothetical protein [Lipingzhangella halophila]MBB4935586.1 hypothetical protein [Lipingzhangella halophila]
MGSTLITEDIWVEERFAEIVTGIRSAASVSAKIRPIEDPDASPEPERESEAPGQDREESEDDRRDSQDDRQ